MYGFAAHALAMDTLFDKFGGIWARRDQLKRPICITLLSLIAAIGVVSTR